jgi:hypothetical protein
MLYLQGFSWYSVTSCVVEIYSVKGKIKGSKRRGVRSGQREGDRVRRVSMGYGLSDTLVGVNGQETLRTGLGAASYPIRQSIVDIETVLLPGFRANVGAYQFENVYVGRSTYPPNIITGVVLLNGEQYRVLTSVTEGFVCYRV